MNLDLDERLIPKGEYRKAQNVLITNSEDSDVGAIENVRGHELINEGTLALGNGVEDLGVVIGSHVDVATERIFWFITNFTSTNFSGDINSIDRADSASDENCRIVMRESTGQTYYLASGTFLNFSTTHHITGVNVIGKFLYWTDNYNQPRYIDIDVAKADAAYYNCEEKISVAKVAPFLPPFLHKSNEASSNANKGDTYTLITTNPSNSSQHTKSEYMQEKFIRFAYRYKYQDNTYSIISPFTQHVFKPLNSGNIEFSSNGKSDAPEPIVSASSQYMYQNNKAPLVKNAYDKVVMRIPIPTVKTGGVITEHETSPSNVSANSYINALKIKSIEILLREAGTSSIQIVDEIDMVNISGLTFERYKVKPKSSGHYYRQTVSYTYLARDPFKVLPEKQLIRVGDNAPVRAKAQELVGNRLVYGNITLGYDLPNDEDNKKGVKFLVTSGPKGENEVSYDANDIGHYFHNREQYKYHNLKQRRTYQVGMVLVDKYGRTSPVIPSTYKVDNLSDTHTVDAVIQDLSSKFNSAYSWSTQHQAIGNALSVEFKDSRIVEEKKTHSTDRPNGWYSWRLVVKQKEQDYYNVYTSHPMNNWSIQDSEVNSFSGYRDQVIKGKFSTNPNSRSWFSLTNDNINKVPRSIKDFNDSGEDFGTKIVGGFPVSTARDGLSGSEVKLYPKVVQVNTAVGSNHYHSTINASAEQDYVPVLSIGSAIDQGLSSMSNAKRDDGSGTVQDSFFTDRPRPYSFLADNHKNPTVAEIPNLYLEPVAVVGEFNVNGSDWDRTSNNMSADMPFGYPKSKDRGLTVFETKPFESNLDIYWETSSCGLVRDLNEHCDFASQGPTNFQITPTFSTNSFAAGTNAPILEEALLGAQIGELTATPYNAGGSSHTISSFQILGVTNSVSDGNDLAKFSVAFEYDKSFVLISPVLNTSAAASAYDLSTSNVSPFRLSKQYISALTTAATGLDFPSQFNAGGWYKVCFFQGHHASVNNNAFIKTTVVVNITGQTNTVQSFLGGSIPQYTGNIGVQRWMLKTNDLFAFYNDNANDVYSITLRAVQSNSITGNGDITATISNTGPTANNPGGIIIPSNTLPGPGGGKNLATLTAVNGSADSNNNGFGLTATLSGDDSSHFNISTTTTDGLYKLGASSTFNFTSIFGLPVNGVYSGSANLAWTVTDNGNLQPTIAQPISLTPLKVVETSGFHGSTNNNACVGAQTSSLTTYYVIKHLGAFMLPQQLNVNNKIYTNATLTTTLGAGFLVVQNSQGQYIPYVINSSGVITSINSQCTI